MPVSAHALPSARFSLAILRGELNKHLLTDSELDAFFLDHFSSTHRLLTLGMDRQQKLNLLLSREDPGKIAAALGLSPPTQVAAHLALQDSFNMKHTPGTLAKLFVYVRDYSQRRLNLITLAASALGIASALAVTNKRPSPPPKNSVPVLSSEPSGAEVWDLRTGRLLGTTPWLVDQSLLPRQICLRRIGSQDRLLTLSEDQLPRDVVTLTLVGSSSTEACDVTIAIP